MPIFIKVNNKNPDIRIQAGNPTAIPGITNTNKVTGTVINHPMCLSNLFIINIL